MDTAEDQNIKRDIFEVIDMNRASHLTGFKQEDLIILVVVNYPCARVNCATYFCIDHFA